MISNVHEAKSQLSKLLDAVERGEEVIVTRRGPGVNRFRIIAEPVADRGKLFGLLKHEVPDDVDYEAADRALEEMFELYLEQKE